MSKEKTKYAVFGLFKSLDAMGSKATLKDGQYFIPVFDNYDDAKQHAGDKYDIIEVTINE